jgi:hypothetical protein
MSTIMSQYLVKKAFSPFSFWTWNSRIQEKDECDGKATIRKFNDA